VIIDRREAHFTITYPAVMGALANFRNACTGSMREARRGGTRAAVFYAGNFLKETQPGRNLNYWALWTGYKF
jgi:hypothetical protein